jgi:hypothetical protein
MQERERKGTAGSILMHANERASVILKRLRRQAFYTFRDLDHLLAASPATLGRDLDRLEEHGKLKRVRGGAQLAEAEQFRLSGVPFHENVGRKSSPKTSDRPGGGGALPARRGSNYRRRVDNIGDVPADKVARASRAHRFAPHRCRATASAGDAHIGSSGTLFR